MLPRILFTSSVAGRIEAVRNMAATATITPSTKELVASRVCLRWDSVAIIKSIEVASMGSSGREAMTNNTRKDHGTPTTTADNTEEARTTTRLSHKESTLICVEAAERRTREQEAPAFVRTTSAKLLRQVTTSSSLLKVPTLSWPLCSASSTSLTMGADQMAIMCCIKPIYKHTTTWRLCNQALTSSTSAAKNRALTTQPIEAVVILPDNITTNHTVAVATTTMAASRATEVAVDSTTTITTTEVTPEALTGDQEAADID